MAETELPALDPKGARCICGHPLDFGNTCANVRMPDGSKTRLAAFCNKPASLPVLYCLGPSEQAGSIGCPRAMRQRSDLGGVRIHHQRR